MIDVEELRDCYTNTPSKMVLLVADGLGGMALSLIHISGPRDQRG